MAGKQGSGGGALVAGVLGKGGNTVSEPGRGYRLDLGEYALTLSSAERCLLFSVS